MRYFLIGICFIFCFLGCRSKKVTIVSPNATISNTTQNASVTTSEILKKHITTEPSFETLSGNMVIELHKNNENQSIPALSFRIKKGETFLLNAPLGLAKALLTPHKVQFYNKLNNTFFDGNYQISERFLGISLEYPLVEKLIFGQILFEKTFTTTANNLGYLLSFEDETQGIRYYLNSEYRLEKAEIHFKKKNIHFQATYTYQQVQGVVFPYQITLSTQTEKNTLAAKLFLESIELNPNVTFPYKVPSGYKPLINE